jgi:hypothetical protein
VTRNLVTGVESWDTAQSCSLRLDAEYLVTVGRKQGDE